MTPKHDVLIDTAFRGYKLNVAMLSNENWNPRFDKGPRQAGLSFKHDTLYIGPQSSPSDILHEICHLVVGPPSVKVSEGYVLLPFEWELAKFLRSLMPRGHRRAFMDGVRAYQDCTEIGRYGMGLDEYGNARAQKWWHRGIERAKRLHLLNSNGMPTFQRACWEGSGVPSRALRWDPSYDDRYPIGTWFGLVGWASARQNPIVFTYEQ